MNIAAKRLQSQRIAGAKFDTPEEVIRWMGAVQAQDYGQAVWAVGVRMKKPSLQAVEKAIANHKIVATWPMRGTIHFVPAEDAKWMVETLAYKKALQPRWHQKLLGITVDDLIKVRQVIQAELKGGKRYTRAQLMELFEAKGLATQDQRGYLHIVHLAEIGVLCQGPLEGKQQTFALLDEWVPLAKKMERTQAIAELAKRYFMSHGPATVHDFANWTSLGMAEAKQGLAAARGLLATEQYDEKDYWLSKEIAAHAEAPRGLYLLPGYDEFLLGYKDRTAVLNADHMRFIVPGNNGVFRPIIVVDGRVVGTWKRTLKKTVVDIEFALFPDCKVSASVLEEAALPYAAFMGLPARATFSVLA
jgi:hypothetical protein